MDRFRLNDPDAPRLAAAVLWDEVGPAYTMETFIRGASAVLDHIEPDAIEQPRLPTRSEVVEKFRTAPCVRPLRDPLAGNPSKWPCDQMGDFKHPECIAAAYLDEGWATEDPEPEVDPAQVDPVIVEICQRIRAGWLPHCLSAGRSWWWGRPAANDGFRLWSEGLVPSMSVVEPMTQAEIDAWTATLNPHAVERASGRVQVTPQ